MASDRCLIKPDWQQQSRPRLVKSMLLAMLFIAAVLTLIKLPSLPIFQRAAIELRLLVEEAAEPQTAPQPAAIEIPEETEPPVAEPMAAEPPPAEAVVAEPQTQDEVRVEQSEVVSAVQATVSTSSQVESMHPTHAEKRRLAALNFPPSEAPIKKPIWENVETDYIGRKVLMNGECYRVLEDWRATYQDIQRDFGQFITYCNAAEKETMDVDWVADIQQKYAYLRHPDGEIPRDELDVLLRRFETPTQE